MNNNEHIVLELRKFVAPEVVFGSDARKLAARSATNLGIHKAMLVSDEGIMQTPWVKEIENILRDNSLPYVIFSDVTPNPRVGQIMKGYELFKNERCDGIIALGGGSVIDCAKGIAIVSSNDCSILDFEGIDKIPFPMPPLVCIPTSTSAAEVSQFAIINDTNRKRKFAIISKALVPDIALIDPVTLTTMSQDLMAFSGIDALSHAIEAYVSNACSNLTDLHALSAMRLITKNLRKALFEPQNMQYQGALMLAGFEAGLAFSNASLGCVHSLSHALGGFLDLPHGELNACLLPTCIQYNLTSSPDKFLTIGEIFGVTVPEIVTNLESTVISDAIRSYIESVGLKMSLKDKGLQAKDIPKIARMAMDDPCNATNPRTPTIMDFENIIQSML
jgi:alcohol dehydrogenase